MMNPEGAMLNDISQTEKDTSCLSSHIWGTLKKKNPHKKIVFAATEGRGLEEVGLDEDGQKGPTSTDKTQWVLRMSCAIRCCVYVWKLLRVVPKGSHHKTKKFSTYLRWQMLTKLITVIVSKSKSNHYAVYLQLIQCCMSIISQ